MNKLPLWVYNYELKRHEVFPHHLLTQNPDGSGSVGLYITWGDKEKMAALLKYKHHFDEGVPAASFSDVARGYFTVVSTSSPPAHTFYALKQREEK